MTAPLLKWAGGKARMVADIREHFPKRSLGFIREPFCGSAAFYLAEGNRAAATLNDLNARLIECYRWVQADSEEFTRALYSLPNGPDWRSQYYAVRAAFNAAPVSSFDPMQAARMVWLNKAGFNGLYRENAQGAFNVPLGSYTKLALPLPDHIREVSAALQSATFTLGTYRECIEASEADDWIYADPPYDGDSFTGYVAGGFRWSDHVALADLCAAAVARGVHVVISNGATPRVMALYTALGFHFRTFGAKSSIGRSAESRTEARAEMLAWASPDEPLTPDDTLCDLLNLLRSS